MSIDEELLLAWQAGDPAAREEAWNRLWRTYYSAAVNFCSNFPGDARACALDAIAGAGLDLERTLKRGDFRWSGESDFTRMVGKYVFNRCRDACRNERRWSSRRDDLPGAEDDNADERLAEMMPVEPTQEAGPLAVARTREAIDDLIVTIARRREICHRQPALAAVLGAELEYIRECIVRTVTGVDPGVIAGMTIDDLIPHMNRDEFEASAPEMSQFVMARLGINRNVLDLRQSRIARAVRGCLGDEPDAGAAAV